MAEHRKSAEENLGHDMREKRGEEDSIRHYRRPLAPCRSLRFLKMPGSVRPSPYALAAGEMAAQEKENAKEKRDAQERREACLHYLG